MIKYLEEHPWKIIEKGFHPQHQRSSESIFSIANGHFGQRANHEESYSGDSLQGSYVAGVYYPDKTKVGWWKNGYPEYFAKVLNSVNWIGIRIWVNQTELDLNTWEVLDFERVLDMKTGLLSRKFSAKSPEGITITVATERLCSLADDECAAIRYSFSVDRDADVKVQSYLDSAVVNEDTNWEAGFWEFDSGFADTNSGLVMTTTKKTQFVLAVTMKNKCTLGEVPSVESSASFAAQTWTGQIKAGANNHIEKYVGLCNSLNYSKSELDEQSKNAATRAFQEGFDSMKTLQAGAWAQVWEMGDIQIEGDVSAQQGIRFNIFQLNQTYTGQDDRLNIGPKGFTGEKYGGSTYWDTEAYCLPFYLSTKDPKIARQLLVYRFNHLEKAIENAAKLGFTNGAALYPMVTMNGEECHNEWEITFEEIHRNGAIAFAIYNYVRHTRDTGYLADHGFDVLLGISRFWAQRVNWSEDKLAYVMLGVTGPNEYENNVNNNWYTNYIARWCLTYTLKSILYMKEHHGKAFAEKSAKWSFNEAEETPKWADIIEKIYLPKLEGTEIFLQQDGFLDKQQLSVDDLKNEDRPINQKWSWDRILRSIFIKQADTLQGIYLFEEHFSKETIAANFDFYEPKTVHESSLSPCIHVILASKLGRKEKAYELYLRTSRLDLDDYNHEAYQGLHITSMAGTWMSVVEGFGGMRVNKDHLYFNPVLPDQWKSFAFKVVFRERVLDVNVDSKGTTIKLLSGKPLDVILNGKQTVVA
jgi:maltose phosphorylase